LGLKKAFGAPGFDSGAPFFLPSLLSGMPPLLLGKGRGFLFFPFFGVLEAKAPSDFCAVNSSKNHFLTKPSNHNHGYLLH
jgi:hypothetical protein